MGRSRALNFARNGYSVAGYDVHIKFEVSYFKDKSMTIFIQINHNWFTKFAQNTAFRHEFC